MIKELTKLQKMERANRKHRVMLARGLTTPKGTKPKHYEPVAEPILRPAPAPSMSLGFWDSMFKRFGWKYKALGEPDKGGEHPKVEPKIEPKGIYKQ